jgi:hypothetical protein
MVYYVALPFVRVDGGLAPVRRRGDLEDLRGGAR